MFEKLFTYAAVLKRHREGPLARERATYLERLASQGMARETLLWRARYSLCVARGLEGWPIEHRFVESDIDKLATAWATTRVAQGMARGPKWPHHLFHFAATDFLRTIGRLDAPPPVASGPLEPGVGNAIAHYLRHARPKSASRIVFLTVRAPQQLRLRPQSHVAEGQGLHGVSLLPIGDPLGNYVAKIRRGTALSTAPRRTRYIIGLATLRIVCG